MKKIVVSGGGTGGHLFPAIAAGEELLNCGYEVHLITDNRCQKYLTPDLKLTTHIIHVRLNAKNLGSKIYSGISLFIATLKSLLLLWKM